MAGPAEVISFQKYTEVTILPDGTREFTSQSERDKEQNLITELTKMLFPWSVTQDDCTPLDDITRERLENLYVKQGSSHLYVLPFVHGATGTDHDKNRDGSNAGIFLVELKNGTVTIVHRGRPGSETYADPDRGSGSAAIILGGTTKTPRTRHTKSGSAGEVRRSGITDPPINLQFYTSVIPNGKKQAIVTRDFGKDEEGMDLLKGTVAIEKKENAGVITISYYILKRPGPPVRAQAQRAMAAIRKQTGVIGVFEPIRGYTMPELLHIIDEQFISEKTVILSNCATHNYVFGDLLGLIEVLKIDLCVHGMAMAWVLINGMKQTDIEIPDACIKSAKSRGMPALEGENTQLIDADEVYATLTLKGPDKGIIKQTELVNDALSDSIKALVKLLRTRDSSEVPVLMTIFMETINAPVSNSLKSKQIVKPFTLPGKKKRSAKQPLDWGYYGRDSEKKFVYAIMSGADIKTWDLDARTILEDMIGLHRFSHSKPVVVATVGDAGPAPRRQTTRVSQPLIQSKASGKQPAAAGLYSQEQIVRNTKNLFGKGPVGFNEAMGYKVPAASGAKKASGAKRKTPHHVSGDETHVNEKRPKSTTKIIEKKQPAGGGKKTRKRVKRKKTKKQRKQKRKINKRTRRRKSRK